MGEIPQRPCWFCGIPRQFTPLSQQLSPISSPSRRRWLSPQGTVERIAAASINLGDGLMAYLLIGSVPETRSDTRTLRRRGVAAPRNSARCASWARAVGGAAIWRKKVCVRSNFASRMEAGRHARIAFCVTNLPLDCYSYLASSVPYNTTKGSGDTRFFPSVPRNRGGHPGSKKIIRRFARALVCS